MSISYQSPSNIALIKYWGKRGRQEPQNSSISFSLSHSHTITSLSYEPKAKNGQIDLSFKFEGVQNDKFAAKILRFLQSVGTELPFLYDYKLDISSQNSFPHSAGIASSASSMSALACCLVEMGEQVGFEAWPFLDKLQNSSYFSRLASGSACRSVYGGAVIWGKTQHQQNSSDMYAVPFQKLHPIFTTYHDTILLVSQQEKSVSSSAGHSLMEGNPFAAARYKQAEDNMGRILSGLEAGDVDAVGEIMEEEALTLHALMMASRPSFILLAPNSLHIIEKVKTWRKTQQLPLYFSIDAGPNIHLLYPDSIFGQVQQFIKDELSQLCEQGRYINDQVGNQDLQALP